MFNIKLILNDYMTRNIILEIKINYIKMALKYSKLTYKTLCDVSKINGN